MAESKVLLYFSNVKQECAGDKPLLNIDAKLAWYSHSYCQVYQYGLKHGFEIYGFRSIWPLHRGTCSLYKIVATYHGFWTVSVTWYTQHMYKNITKLLTHPKKNWKKNRNLLVFYLQCFETYKNISFYLINFIQNIFRNLYEDSYMLYRE